jgi:hypothetical protein
MRNVLNIIYYTGRWFTDASAQRFQFEFCFSLRHFIVSVMAFFFHLLRMDFL